MIRWTEKAVRVKDLKPCPRPFRQVGDCVGGRKRAGRIGEDRTGNTTRSVNRKVRVRITPGEPTVMQFELLRPLG